MTNLATARWPELGAVDVALVPLGSTEQHGPHLPFDTDTVIASAVAAAVATALAESGVNAWATPVIPVGSSGEHQDFDGTISIGNEALTQLLIELARSVRTWAPRIVFVNGHGGNVPVLRDVVSQLVKEDHVASWFACGVDGQDAHAGREETSLMLHLAPETVRVDLARPGNTEDLASLMTELRRSGVKSVSPNGVLGDPGGASADEGAAILARMVAHAVASIG